MFLEARRSQGASRTQEELGGLFLSTLGGFGRFPLVSHGPIVICVIKHNGKSHMEKREYKQILNRFLELILGDFG